MDWLEKKAGQIKQYFRNASLTKSLLCYMLLGIIGALTVWLFTRNLCVGWISVLSDASVYGSGGRVEEWVLRETLFYEHISPALRMVCFIYFYGLFFDIIVACLLVCWAFLKYKIRPAVRAVQESAGYLAAGDLGHELSYHSGDEMGGLCRDFESMRCQLVEEKKRQWQSQEEQRKINAAFAHDIRTPLTVIKGNTEFLQRYLPQGRVPREMLEEKLSAMQHQTERLIQFSGTMTRFQSEEAREVCGAWIDSGQLVRNMRDNASGMAELHEAGCEVRWSGVCGEIFVDAGIVEEVFDNLLSNAMRYAKKQVTIDISLEKRRLSFFVKDDGAGFSAKALRSATDAYFSEEKEGREHFGIGLSVARMLCEKHGGYLQLVNSVDGGAIASAVFSVDTR